MAKKAAKAATTGPAGVTYNPPPPEVRFELEDGLPANLPSVGKQVTLTVSGELCKVAKDEWDNRDCITVRRPKVKLTSGGKGEKA
jgi:hypothetical protein